MGMSSRLRVVVDVVVVEEEEEEEETSRVQEAILESRVAAVDPSYEPQMPVRASRY